jgi:L-aspartate oxidase
MWEGVGIERSAASIRRVLQGFSRIGWLERATLTSRVGVEAQNLLLVAKVVAKAALERRGSVGCHFRRDYPRKGPHWRRHVTVQTDKTEESRRHVADKR